MGKASPGALRTTRRALVLAVVVVLVLMALAGVAASQLLPMLERHPERVQAWLGERAGHPVHFDALETEWTRRGPLLRLDGLRIGRGAEAVTIGAAEVLVAQYAGLLPGRSLTELRLRNLDLTLARADDGRWHVRGLPGQDSGRDPFAALERLGELQVIGGRLTVDAPALGLHATIPRIDVRLRVDGSQVRAASRAWMDDGHSPLRAAARFDRDGGDGSLYVGIEDGDLDAWSPLLTIGGTAVDDGHGRAEAWAELRAARIDGVFARVDLRDVGLRGTAGNGPLRAAFDHVAGRFQWTRANAGWRLDVPELLVTTGDDEWRSERVAMQAGGGHALVAGRIEAAPLLRVLALDGRVGRSMRDWLSRANANVVLSDVALSGPAVHSLHGRARMESVRFAAVDDRPGIDGLAGGLVVDGRGVLLEFDPQASMRFDWPSGFGVVHEVALRGEVSAWPQGGGWQVQAPALRVDGDGYGADVRGGLLFQADGTRPRIDIAARLDETAVPVAKGFWVRHQMPAQAIEWLDAALVGGRVVDGRAVVSGDLDDWPFEAASGNTSTGLFHAQAGLDDATLKFQPDWPAAEGMLGSVRFIGNGFDFHGSGRIAGVAMDAVEAGIDDFGRATLDVSTHTASGTGEVVSLLQQSPLAVDALRELAVDGPMAGSFAMRLPLHGSRAGPDISGTVRLRGVQAAMPQWDFALDDVRGELAFDEHGFLAPQLNAWQDGQPAVVTLRAGSGHVRAEGHAFEGEMRANLEAPELLQRAAQLDWLQPHVDGRSLWSVGVTVPRDGSAGQSQLLLRSDLVGTRLDLPEPLRKPAAVPLQARIRIPLPLEGGDLGVQFGQRMALRALVGEGPPAVRVLLGPGEAGAPADGLVIEGRAAELAAMEWAGLVAASTGDDVGGESGAGAGLELGKVDVAVDRLLIGGGGFGAVHLASARDDGAMQLRFEGDAIAGSVTLPRGDGGALTGHFERLHWQRPAAAAAGRGGAGAGPAAIADGPDPALIPPVRLSVGDLRVDEARLGAATLHTSRMPGGMRIEQLEAQSPLHHVVVSGEWTGRGARAVTRADMRVASGNFGQLLDGLGYQGHLRGGDGRLELSASWPASPAGFSAEMLEGHLRLSLRDGHLVELEPGAGRLLGLLSIAELPRRLSLDFRDFFERGFAFNRIEGEIRVESGRARSEGLVMDGPAATIRVAGQTDLRARSYDQTVEVLPKSGNVLTAVGAIAGGPVGAAVGAMANAMLRKPLSGLGATAYRITGPWDEPEVDVVRRDPPSVAGNERGPDDD